MQVPVSKLHAGRTLRLRLAAARIAREAGWGSLSLSAHADMGQCSTSSVVLMADTQRDGEMDVAWDWRSRHRYAPVQDIDLKLRRRA